MKFICFQKWSESLNWFKSNQIYIWNSIASVQWRLVCLRTKDFYNDFLKTFLTQIHINHITIGLHYNLLIFSLQIWTHTSEHSNMKEENQKCTYKIPCSETVQCVEFSPFEWSCNLLAVGTQSGVSIFSCRFQVIWCLKLIIVCISARENQSLN